MLRGSVSEFDDAKGLGTVRGDDGTEYQFHCIEIADGTRTIVVGQSVWFQTLARFGRLQAGCVHKQ